LVAFELTRRLRRSGDPQPAALIAAGHAAPHLPRRTPTLHRLPADLLVGKLDALEGLPPEVARNAEFLELMVPVTRADLRIHETYVYYEEPPLECAIVAATGWSDPQVTPAEAEAWRLHTRSEFCFKAFDDGHFFLTAARDELLEMVRRQLSEPQ
jgi:surfactin synthase thioesterase subunit